MDLEVPTPSCNKLARPQVVKLSDKVFAELIISTSLHSIQEHHRAVLSTPNSIPCTPIIASPPRTTQSSLNIQRTSTDDTNNKDRTKEIIMDFRKKPHPLLPLIIKETKVKRVDSSRMFFIRLLNRARLSHHLLKNAIVLYLKIMYCINTP